MMKHISEKDLQEIAKKFGYTQIIVVARKGGEIAKPEDEQCYRSIGVDKAPWWMSKLRTAFFKHF